MVDIQPQAQQSMSDDQELAKVLAGVSQQADESETTATGTGLVNAFGVEPVADPAAAELAMPADLNSFVMPSALPPAPEAEPVVVAEPTPQPVVAMPNDGSLDTIKKDALQALRPLVDKLELSPQEKYDTYLLLIRSTDDKELIAPAFAAAKNLPDESHRAQALLDIIKEIDYLSGRTAAA